MKITESISIGKTSQSFNRIEIANKDSYLILVNSSKAEILQIDLINNARKTYDLDNSDNRTIKDVDIY